MGAITKRVLSGSTDGNAIDVNLTSVAVAVHTGPSTTSIIDEVWIYAQNNTGTAITTWFAWGATATANQVKIDIAGDGKLKQVFPGLPMQGNATNKTIVVGASAASTIHVYGWVNRIDQT